MEPRKVVAVVDDDPRILESLRELLEPAGYDVRVHASASSLLANDIVSVDCIITDVGMPAIDGFELRRRAKQLRPDLPVFLISGRSDFTEPPTASEPASVFPKPFHGPTLLTAIANAVGRSNG
jgi:FixJ family two-component response regulator